MILKIYLKQQIVYLLFEFGSMFSILKKIILNINQ